MANWAMRPVCTKSKRGAKYLTKLASCKQRRGLLPKDNLTKCKEWAEAQISFIWHIIIYPM